MKKFAITIIIAWLLLMGQPGKIFADYVMMCTFFQNQVARVYNVNDEGEISFDYNLEVGGNPRSLCFAPNGKWGLVGSHTTSYPHTQKTIVLGVDQNRKISVLGTAHNEYGELLAISPDSKYGVYGADLRSLKYNKNGTFDVIPTSNPVVANRDADFSSYSGNLFSNGYPGEITEYKITSDGKISTTEFMIDIEPSSANQDLTISPDGKTCIVLSIGTYEITSLRILKNGGCSIAHQFNTYSDTPDEVYFTPDSKIAVVSFFTIDNLCSYLVGGDSRLTEADSLDLPGYPGEDMAITPDGKYVITRELINNFSFFYVVRLHQDGTLEYLPEKDYICGGHVSAMAFVPPQVTEAEESWTWYE